MHKFLISLTTFLVLLTMLFILGCSNRDVIPTSPQTASDAPLTAVLSDINGNAYQSWGSWILSVDTDTLEFTNEPDREMAAHYNITGLLPTPIIHINSYDPSSHVLDVDVTISNPYFINGFDVRGIIYTDSNGHYLIDPDGLTDLFDIPGGYTVNPFMAYAKAKPNRIFSPLYQETQKFLIYMPPSGGPIRYAFEASFPSNCPEPYDVRNFTQAAGLTTRLGSKSAISVDVFDWQNDTNNVVILASEITGESSTNLSFKNGYTWGTDLINNRVTVAGTYKCLIRASSADSGNFSQYEYIDIAVQEYKGADWTFLVYMHESNLGYFALEDMNEMEVAGSVEGKLNIIVLWDKTDTPDDVILKIQTDPAGFNDVIISTEVDDSGEVIPPGGLDMGDGATLERFLKWGMRNYPAEKYGLDLWDHGDGPFSIMPTAGFIRSCCNGLQIWEIRDAVKAALLEHPEKNKIDFIGFDACLMAYIETGMCLRNVTETCLASEMTEPGRGWFYSTPMTYIVEHSSTSAEQLCTEIVNAYLNTASYDETLGAWRSADLINNVIPALNTFANELMSAKSNYLSAINTCYYATGDWGSGCYEYDIKDLGTFADQIKNSAGLPSSLKNAAQNLMDEIDAAMIIHGHYGSGGGCPYSETGWQIWFPQDYSGDWWSQHRADYIDLEMTDTRWDEWLSAFNG